MIKLRPIAIHLPQFHPIPENNKWWGRGFTEWTNVTKAKPLFKGHYQPHLPADLGFYDLRLPEARQAQADLAREHGIYGFCYYHYWFNGKRILERPVDEILASGKPDFPFMLCWANENWTRKWDGADKLLLLKQEYSETDDLNHIRSLIPYFKDKRYIRINNKVVFSIYRSSLLPTIENTIKVWREECAKEGIDLYLCRFETFGDFGKSLVDQGFDAGIEFQPMSPIMNQFIHKSHIDQIKTVSYRFKFRYYKLMREFENLDRLKNDSLRIIDYNDYVDFLIKNYKHALNYVLFPGVTPSWDNTARNSINPFILLNSNPAKFKEWLRFHAEHFKPKGQEENLLFINAWNEWAEGNHLEPCQKWGLSYLESVKEVIDNL